jgi:hypothetical protein
MSEKMFEGYKPGQLSSEVRAMAERDINAGPFPSLSLIADTHEDEGQSEIASGYRWLIKHRRIPRPDGGTKSDFFWLYTHDEKSTLYTTEFYLPADVDPLMKAIPIEVSGARTQPLANHFLLMSDAYRTAAICLGAHLNKKKYDSKVMLLTDKEQLWYRIPDTLKPYFNSLSVPIPSIEARIERRKEVEREQLLKQRDMRDRAERIARRLTDDFEKQMRMGLPPMTNPCSEIAIATQGVTFDLTQFESLSEFLKRYEAPPLDPRIFIDPKSVF